MMFHHFTQLFEGVGVIIIYIAYAEITVPIRSCSKNPIS